jgi:hypothetical protein
MILLPLLEPIFAQQWIPLFEPIVFDSEVKEFPLLRCGAAKDHIRTGTEQCWKTLLGSRGLGSQCKNGLRHTSDR